MRCDRCCYTCDGWAPRPLKILRTETLTARCFRSALPASGNSSAELSLCGLDKRIGSDDKHIGSDNDRRLAIILEPTLSCKPHVYAGPSINENCDNGVALRQHLLA
jgi:hypothetical protein